MRGFSMGREAENSSRRCDKTSGDLCGIARRGRPAHAAGDATHRGATPDTPGRSVCRAGPRGHPVARSRPALRLLSGETPGVGSRRCFGLVRRWEAGALAVQTLADRMSGGARGGSRTRHADYDSWLIWLTHREFRAGWTRRWMCGVPLALRRRSPGAAQTGLHHAHGRPMPVEGRDQVGARRRVRAACLSLPKASGFRLAAYVVPALVATFAVAGLGLAAARQWRQRRATGAPAGPRSTRCRQPGSTPSSNAIGKRSSSSATNFGPLGGSRTPRGKNVRPRSEARDGGDAWRRFAFSPRSAPGVGGRRQRVLPRREPGLRVRAAGVRRRVMDDGLRPEHVVG